MTDPTSKAVADAVSAERDFVSDLFDRLAACSIAGPGITRDTYGEGEQRAHAVVRGIAADMALEIKGDAAANLYMTMPGRDRSAPGIVMGSHLDSVPNGGNFDGAAGVVAALVAIRALRSLAITPAVDVTAMAIRAEESVWFEVSYVGSRSALGQLPKGALQAPRIDTGRPLADHITACGGSPAALDRGEATLTRDNVKAFLEVHIEQAPQLIEAGRPIAVVTAVPGNFRYPSARIIGAYDHVGLPRRFRHDAVTAAGAFAVGVDRIWREHEAAGRPMAMTIGRFHTNPAEAAMTKVAGEVIFSIDVRAYDEGHLLAIEADLRKLIAAIEAEHRVRFDIGRRTSAEVAPADPRLKAALTASAKALGIPSLTLASPASHDAAAFCAAGIPMAMLLVRNANGSHNPAEAMEIDDFMAAATVLAHWLAGAVG
ncbi:MAG: hydantoinase/carbamoylase family amidase [Hyphomicrobiaceae bacterium]